MKITSNKTYEPGDRVFCILSSNTYLEKGVEYTVEKCVKSYGDVEIYLKERDQQGYKYNPARFLSVKEIRESRINKILNDE